MPSTAKTTAAHNQRNAPLVPATAKTTGTLAPVMPSTANQLSAAAIHCTFLTCFQHDQHVVIRKAALGERSKVPNSDHIHNYALLLTFKTVHSWAVHRINCVHGLSGGSMEEASPSCDPLSPDSTSLEASMNLPNVESKLSVHGNQCHTE